jgi:3-methyladenine DNA glycosylase/8-oxoguanine DNA glycosylase
MSSTVESATEIRPFSVAVPDEALDDLRRRIQATQWPERETVADDSQGVPLAAMQKLARHWATEQYGTLLHFDRRDLHGFWDAPALAGAGEQELRSLKLGDVDEQALREATVDEQRAALLSLCGVGPASVDYILVDVFNAFDEVAHISPWEQRIYSRLLLGASVDEPAPVDVLLDRIARWSPWRALAIHYLWEDLFWRYKTDGVDWLAPLIRL